MNSVPFLYSGFLWLQDDSTVLSKREVNEEEIELELSGCEDQHNDPEPARIDLGDLEETLK